MINLKTNAPKEVVNAFCAVEGEAFRQRCQSYGNCTLRKAYERVVEFAHLPESQPIACVYGDGVGIVIGYILQVK